MTNEQYVAVIGDQCETQKCWGPFADPGALFAWTQSQGIADERVSVYEIHAPRELTDREQL